MMHVLEFSPDGKLFALINDQGVLRIWDTETNELKQEFTPNLHLSGPCAALTWISFRKARKSSDAGNDSLYIALGTNTGGIALYSYALGKIERSFKDEGHSGRVNGIVHDAEGRVYTCGDDGQIIVWSLQKEKKLDAWLTGNEKLHSICYLPHSKSVVVAGRKIKVYSTGSKELLQSFTGHSSDINVISSFAVNKSTEFVITASRMERLMCIWKIGKKSLNKTASCSLLMEDVANCITSYVHADTVLQVASVTRSGVVHVYHIPIDNMKANKPIKPKVTIKIASDYENVVEPISAVAARTEFNNSSQELLFGYGDNHFLVFERVEPNFEEKSTQVLIRTDPKRLHTKSARNKQTGTNAALKTLQPRQNENDVDYKSALTVTKKKLKPVEMPMEDRLQNLNHIEPSGAGVQAQSKVQLLVQALHSKDQILLRSVLCTDDMKTIQLTLQRLPVQYVGSLVNELTLLMQLKHNNVEYSLKWLKILAQTHSSQLMALGADDLLSKFGVCIGIIEHRANCLKELSKLNGRLQLLVSQIKRNADVDSLNNENVLVYDDSESSNSDLEENNSAHTSDSEWEEDDVDDGDGEEQMEQDDDDDASMDT